MRLRYLRHRPGGFVAALLSSFLGTGPIMTFASLIDTAAVPARRSVSTA
jgi:putative ABC transport system permease protein